MTKKGGADRICYSVTYTKITPKEREIMRHVCFTACGRINSETSVPCGNGCDPIHYKVIPRVFSAEGAIECPHCRRFFVPANNRQKYCDDVCKRQARKNAQKRGDIPLKQRAA